MGSLNLEAQTKMTSSPDKAKTAQYCQMIWVRQTRPKGVREEPVWVTLLNVITSSNLVDMGWVAARIDVMHRELFGRFAPLTKRPR